MKKSIFSLIIFLMLVPSLGFSAKSFKIIVLPFDKINKERNMELETLSVGLSETLSGALSNIKNFIIIDANRVKKYLLSNAEFNQAIGTSDKKILNRICDLTKDKLEGDFIIYGSFYKIGNQIKFEAKFLNVGNGNVLSAASVNGVYPDRIFELQDELAKKLVVAINGGDEKKLDLSDAARKMDEYINSTKDYAAYQYYIQARQEHMKFTIKDYPRAIELYKKALSIDPKYALSWAGMSEVHALWGWDLKTNFGGNFKPVLDLSIQEGQKAVDLNPKLYQSYKALARAYQCNEQFDKAGEAVKKSYELNSQDPEILLVKASLVNYNYKEMGTLGTEANKWVLESLRINPELVQARFEYAYSLDVLKKSKEAIDEYEKVLAINPRHLSSLYNIAILLYDDKDYKKSIEYTEKAVRIEPSASKYYYMIGLDYYAMKDWKSAEKYFRDTLQKKADHQDGTYMLGASLYNQGRYREARDAYAKVLKMNPSYPNAETWKNKSAEMIGK